MDTSFLHKAADLLRGQYGERTESGAEIPVRTRVSDEEDMPGAAPVEPLYPDQAETIAELLDQRLEAMAQGQLYAYQGQPPEELGNALNLDAGLLLIALDETLNSGDSGIEHLRAVMEQWGELRGEALPEEELEDFLGMASEYLSAWKDFPNQEVFPFILAIGATDTYMLAEEEEAPDPEHVAGIAGAMMEDAVRFYGEVTRIVGAR
ncbi:hypothetical protein AN478_12875 [Thiohalorhabdus denitrificans]|uniref:Uncharacterized protein n=1 Tax=Thiohalorhabdus denitrificans TaxID=381306 RepID=A0A0P9CJT9_9GAMM|nr:hypothetical protein [Thiohalorhabdus denitrificans]KPV39164.1 hypothetical protein AN478_12875 [Thiohalorhabdus denitrificans]SCX75952.1 hypothetical protein SAMN05661077_0278 [Thiohalorhabdus denitrificans]